MREERRITPTNVHKNYSAHSKFLKPGLGWNLGLHHEILANKRLSHGMRNYSVGFVVNGIGSYKISLKSSNISGSESLKAGN